MAEEQGKVTGPLEKSAQDRPGGGEAEKPEAQVPKPRHPPAANFEFVIATSLLGR